VTTPREVIGALTRPVTVIGAGSLLDQREAQLVGAFAHAVPP